MRASLILCALMAACGGTDTQADADSGADSGADVLVEAGPCAPEGDWTWTFGTDAGSPQVDHVKIVASPDAGSGAYEVTFLDREVPKDTCTPGPDGGADAGADAGPAVIVASGTLDAASCTVTVGYSLSWCHSGEQQCQDWSIAVVFSGNTATGTAKEVGGWCMDKHTTEYSVTATKP
ncbi:MAG: hypothetical protein HYZ29_01470 [Myxococcales bacterium]|nr:hypothetical protein [Myxococcales bacterium]